MVATMERENLNQNGQATPQATDWQEILLDLEPKYELLSVSKLIDNLKTGDGHQRNVSEAKVAKMVKWFDPLALSTPTISRRANGFEWTVNGQHRLHALARLAVELVRCEVYEGLTRAQEAGQWVKLNTTNQPLTFDKFRGNLEAGEVDAVEIDRIVRVCGYRIPNKLGSSQQARTINAVAALLYVYGRGSSAALSDVLTTIRHAWGDIPNAANADNICGIHIVLYVYRDQVRRERLVQKLAEVSPVKITQKASTYVLTEKGGKRVSFAHAVVATYNDHATPRTRLDPSALNRFRESGKR